MGRLKTVAVCLAILSAIVFLYFEVLKAPKVKLDHTPSPQTVLQPEGTAKTAPALVAQSPAPPTVLPEKDTSRTRSKKRKPASIMKDLDDLAEGRYKSHSQRKPAQLGEAEAHYSDEEWLKNADKIETNAAVAHESVRRYLKALQALRDGEASDTVELVYRLGMKAAADLTFIEGAGMDQASYNGINEKMKESFVLDRSGLFFVFARPEFFRTLAQQYSSEKVKDSSVIFFDGIESTFLRGKPNYVRTLKQFRECVAYGDGKLLTFYKIWTGYKNQFKRSGKKAAPYGAFVDKFVEEVTHDLDENKCACGGENEVKKEFSIFKTALPNEPLSSLLDKRLLKLARASGDGEEEFNFHCQPRESRERSIATDESY